jgi:hypothetical protein
MARPKKIKFPIGLDEWLRRVLPKTRPEVRMKIFRELRRSILRADLKRPPTEQELVSDIALIRATKFEQGNRIYEWAYCLRDFVPEFHKQNRIARAKVAAVSRWSKKSEKSTCSDF